MRLNHTLATAAAAGLALAFATILALGMTVAQSSLAALAGAQEAPVPWQAFLQAGTCARIGDVVAELGEVALPDGKAQGAASALPVARGRVEASIRLDDLLATDHAIVVTRGIDPAADELVACGAVGGVPGEDGAVEIGLGEVNDTGLGGLARLSPADGGTAVEIRLTGRGLAPAATPAPGAVVVPVEITAFAYVPAAVSVPVGGAVAWTNADPVAHTATARDRAILQTGRIDAGQTATVTFTEPGQYDYFCEYHTGMRGTIVVE